MSEHDERLESLITYRLLTNEGVRHVEHLGKEVAKHFGKGELPFAITLDLLSLKDWTKRMKAFQANGETAI